MHACLPRITSASGGYRDQFELLWNGSLVVPNAAVASAGLGRVRQSKCHAFHKNGCLRIEQPYDVFMNRITKQKVVHLCGFSGLSPTRHEKSKH